MRALLRRVMHRATGALLRPLEEQARAQQRELMARLERLEKRMDSALAKGQAEARLLAARIDTGSAKPARRLGAKISSVDEPRGLKPALYETIPPTLSKDI